MENAPLPSAPIWRRLAALIYDSLILVALSFLYGAAATLLGTLAGWHDGDYEPMFQHWLFPLGWVLTLLGFYAWFWHKSGQTIGMRTWRLKLIATATHSTPAWPKCLLRTLVTPPLVLLGGLGYWFGWLNSRGDCLQDKLSGTRVVVVPKDS